MNEKEFFKKAKEKNITNIQITEKTIIESSFELLNKELESYDDINDIYYDIKAEYKGKTVKCSCNYLSEKILDLLIEKAKETDSFYEDEYLNDIKRIEKEPIKNIDISQVLKKLKELDKLRLENKEIQKLKLYYSESYTNTRIINSNDIDISTSSHLCNFYVEVVSELNNEFTSHSGSALTTNKEEIDFKEIIEDTINKVIILRNKKKIETKKYNIILDSYCASRILSHIIGMLSKTNIRNKVSCLENKMNKQVFSNKITIIEDPTNKIFPGYRLFDDEGTLTSKKTLIDKGVVKKYLYNIKEAKIEKTKSTGNGYQDISTRNMYIVPGKINEKDLLKNLSDGIYIVDYMGSSNTSINQVTGQISLQIFGFVVKNGELVSGIEPSIMTTTIFELLSNIDEVGNKLHHTSTNSSSPMLLIKDISIAR